MSEIIDVNALEVLDSRGNPTVEVEILLESGAKEGQLFLLELQLELLKL